MKTANTKPSNAVVYDVQTVTHAAQASLGDSLLIADLKRLGTDSLNKEFRTSFFVGSMAAIFAKASLTVTPEMIQQAATVYSKANADAKGDKAKRTKAEQAAYNTAKVRFSRWVSAIGKPAVQSRSDKAKAESAAKAKQAATEKLAKAREKDLMAPIPAALTPTANNAVTADRFMRQQTAMMLAYCDKNKALIPDAMRHAVAELAECVRAVPVACPDDPEDDASA